jgi:hypothetical protein
MPDEGVVTSGSCRGECRGQLREETGNISLAKGSSPSARLSRDEAVSRAPDKRWSGDAQQAEQKQRVCIFNHTSKINGLDGIEREERVNGGGG